MRRNSTSFGFPEITSGLSYFTQANAILLVAYLNLIRQKLHDLAEVHVHYINHVRKQVLLAENMCVCFYSNKLYTLNISTMLNATVPEH